MIRQHTNSARIIAQYFVVLICILSMTTTPVTTLAVVDNESTPPASTSQRKSPLADSLRSHVEYLDKYDSLAREYDNQVEALRGAAQPNLQGIAAAEAKLKRLRTDLPKFQSEFRNGISKIKSAGRWTPELDSRFETIATRENPDLAQLVKKGGGLRSVMEKLNAALGKLPAVIDESEKELNELKAKAVGAVNSLDVRIIGVGYTAVPGQGGVSCTTTVAYCTYCTLVFVVAGFDEEGGYEYEAEEQCSVGKCRNRRTTCTKPLV